MIESIESKLISVCLIHVYSLIAQLHIFVYERAEFSFISLKCTKGKFSILNNFEQNLGIYFKGGITNNLNLSLVYKPSF